MKYQQYLSATGRLLKTSAKRKSDYMVTLAGKKFVVKSGVFSPYFFRDTEIFAKNLPVHKGESFLEIGPGTGAISILSAQRGVRKVLGIDINPKAVSNTRENIRLHNAEANVNVRQGDLFSALYPGEKFDTIFWNMPFGYVEVPFLSDLEKSVFDPFYRSTERFILEGPAFLKPNGRLLIGFSSTLGRLDLLKVYCKKSSLRLRQVHKQISREVYPVSFEIFEARRTWFV